MSEQAGAGRIALGWTVSTTAGVVGRNAASLLVLGVLFVGLPDVLSDLLDLRGLADNAGHVGASGGQFATKLLSLITQSLLLAAVTHLVIADLRGGRAPFSESLRAAVDCLGPVLGLSVLTSLGIALGTVLLIVPGVILALRWLVAVPVRVVEGPGVGRALSRSGELMRGNYWRCLALVLLYIVAAAALGMAVLLIDTGDTAATTTPLGIAVESVLVTALGVVSAVGVAVVYAQLRRVKEGAVPDDLAAVFS